MSFTEDFGPNTPAVRAFLESLSDVPWFSQVEQPTERDAELVRVGLDFLAGHHGSPYADWGNALVSAENRIERLVFDHRRLGEWNKIREVVDFPTELVDEFYLNLEERHPGYYGDTCLYAHELVDPPLHMLWGAVDEVMLADLDPGLNFFGSQIPWFRRGHWPCGWQGDWPQGKLILW